MPTRNPIPRVCPQCGWAGGEDCVSDTFQITAMVFADVNPEDGSWHVTPASTGWDMDCDCWCPMCEHWGVVRDFIPGGLGNLGHHSPELAQGHPPFGQMRAEALEEGWEDDLGIQDPFADDEKHTAFLTFRLITDMGREAMAHHAAEMQRILIDLAAQFESIGWELGSSTEHYATMQFDFLDANAANAFCETACSEFEGMVVSVNIDGEVVYDARDDWERD